jgi:hypothetical protein
MGLSMGTMVAGWDKTGPNLYYVDNDGLRIKNEKFSVRDLNPGAALLQTDMFLLQVGSGSPYAFGVLDTGYSHDLSVADACELGRRAIYHATFRDAYATLVLFPSASLPFLNCLLMLQLLWRYRQRVPHPRARLDARFRRRREGLALEVRHYPAPSPTPPADCSRYEAERVVPKHP